MAVKIKAWILLAACAAAMVGFAYWNYLQVRNAAHAAHWRWAGRVSMLIADELPKYRRWIDQVSTDVELRALALEAPFRPAALYLVDTRNHRTLTWFSRLPAEFRGRLQSLDPRLVVLQIKAQETQETQMGPLLSFDETFYVTAVRALGPRTVLIAVIEAPEIRRLVEEESRFWRQRAFIYDENLKPVFRVSSDAAVRAGLRDARVRAGKDKLEGRLHLQGSASWRTVASYRFDATLRWLFVVLEPVPSVFTPLVVFGLCLGALLFLSRIPWRAVEDLRRMKTADDLQRFASKVDNFIRGRETTLPEPPVPYGRELGTIPQALRWMMPQWKKAEQFPKELVLERKLLSLLIESLPEGILFFNAQGQIQLSNEVGRVFLALQQEQGREYKVVSGIQVPRGLLEPYVEPVFTGQQKNQGKEVEVKWADGKHLYRIWVESVESEPGRTDGFMVVVRDITFRRQWEYVQEQVLSGITHDLRGPLSAVMGYLDLIKRQLTNSGPTPKASEYVKLAREAAVRLNQMVSDILDVVRFEQGKIELAPEDIPVARVFERLKNIFSVSAEQKGVQLRLETQCASSAAVWGDPKLLERVFDNLVSNAIKFTPAGGTIVVTARAVAGKKMFEVSDTGRGIPKEAQSRVFEKFQQVRPGDRSGGYGLGLAVVKFIVEAHKGEIHIESEVGIGSKFTFWIPDASAVPAAA